PGRCPRNQITTSCGRISMNRTIALAAATLAAGFTTAAADQMAGHEAHAKAKAPVPMRAVAVLGSASGSTAHGTVWFSQEGDKVKVVADLEGLTPNAQHAMHVHEFGDCSSPDGASAGSHYNPEGHPHALPPTDPRHAGDLGNVTADADGKAHYEI